MPRAPKKRTRLEDARARMYRDLLFGSAETVFGARGYAGATMQDIAAEAGVSLKTLYATYPSKQQLYEEVLSVRANEFIECTTAAMQGIEDPVERVREGIVAYVGFLLDHEDWLQIHLRGRLVDAVQPGGGDAASPWHRGLDGYVRVIRKGQREGRFGRGDPEDMAVLAQAVIRVQLARELARGERRPERVVEAILVHVWRLLAVEPPSPASRPGST